MAAFSHLRLLLLICMPCFVHIGLAQLTTCAPNDKVYKALSKNIENGAEIFCQQLLDTVSLSGTLRDTFTIPVYTTVTDSNSQQPVTSYFSTSTRTTITSTSYSSQPKRTPSSFTQPLPTYVEQFKPAKVSSACSCIITEINTYVQRRNCERTKDEFYTTTFTYTTGKPGKKTRSYTYTDTETSTVRTTAPFPAQCPQADNVDYVATDHSVWERGCKTYLNQYREIDTIHADSFRGCIEKCVDYNTQRGYKQCQAVAWVPGQKGPNCLRINQPGYFAHADGAAEVATLRFIEPTTTETDYCATVSGAAP